MVTNRSFGSSFGYASITTTQQGAVESCPCSKWNYVDTEQLAKLKLGTGSNEGIFLETSKQNLTSDYEPLRSWINRLRRVVLPKGRLRKEEDEGLASRMMSTLAEAQTPPDVLAKLNTSSFSNWFEEGKLTANMVSFTSSE